MRLTKFGRVAVVTATAVVAGGALLASPASASQPTVLYASYRGAQAEADNSPANGAKGWVWGWSGYTDFGGDYVRIDYQRAGDNDNYFHTLVLYGKGTSVAKSLNSPVKAIRICVAPANGSCGQWTRAW
jgi:hypothetical protein